MCFPEPKAIVQQLLQLSAFARAPTGRDKLTHTLARCRKAKRPISSHPLLALLLDYTDILALLLPLYSYYNNFQFHRHVILLSQQLENETLAFRFESGRGARRASEQEK